MTITECQFTRPFKAAGVPDLAIDAKMEWYAGFTFWHQPDTSQVIAQSAGLGLQSWVVMEDPSGASSLVSAGIAAVMSLSLFSAL